MKTSKSMQTIIEKIAAKHGVDLSTVGAYLKLEMDGYLPLHIEIVWPHQVAIAHTFIQEGDVMRDPEVICFTGDPTLGWVPITITQDPVGVYREYADLDEDGARIIRYLRRGQAELTAFVNTFARNIVAQKWLQHGQAVSIKWR